MGNKDNRLTNSELELVWERLIEEFPFKGYINIARKSGYFEMVRRVAKWAGKSARILAVRAHRTR